MFLEPGPFRVKTHFVSFSLASVGAMPIPGDRRRMAVSAKGRAYREAEPNRGDSNPCFDRESALGQRPGLFWQSWGFWEMVEDKEEPLSDRVADFGRFRCFGDQSVQLSSELKSRSRGAIGHGG